jgi:hypothetical protein
MRIRRFGIALVLLSVTPLAMALDPPRTVPSPMEWVSAVADRQADIDLAVAPIRSRADLRAFLAQHRDSSLHRLKPDVRERFIDGLVFTEKGLASYSFLPIERLSVTEAYRLLSLFGVHGSIGGIRGLRPTNATERTMLEAGMSLAAKPGWMDGICVINGPGPGRCEYLYGSNCSRACD